MENIDIYIKCYFSLIGRNHLVSESITEHAWEYVLSEQSFCKFLHNKIEEVEVKTNQTGQTVKDMYIDIFYNQDNDELKIILYFYTKEECEFKSETYLKFPDFNTPVNTVKKYHTVKKDIERESRKVTYKSIIASLLAIFLLILGQFLILYSINIYNISLVSVIGIVLLGLGVYFDRIKDEIINRCLSKNTELKLKFQSIKCLISDSTEK